MRGRGVVIPKTWRSELGTLALFFVLCGVSISLSNRFPGSVITGELFKIGSSQIMLSLPLFWLIPTAVLMTAVIRIYNVRFFIDHNGIECRVGRIALHQRITRIRYQDVRSVETEQTVLDRALDIGDVCIATAATGGLEVLFEGVAAPKEVQEMIQRERDKRQRFEKRPPQVKPESANA